MHNPDSSTTYEKGVYPGMIFEGTTFEKNFAMAVRNLGIVPRF